jgi:holo-[acyl-carrier protein] synthase
MSQKLQRVTIVNLNSSDILGIGTDIIEIRRIKEAIAQHGERFLKKIFTENEIAYCCRYRDASPHFAGRFAAKEAVSKALGTGLDASISWHQIEILNNPQGKPEVHLSLPLKNNLTFLLSISHCREYATATVIAFSTHR